MTTTIKDWLCCIKPLFICSKGSIIYVLAKLNYLLHFVVNGCYSIVHTMKWNDKVIDCCFGHLCCVVFHKHIYFQEHTIYYGGKYPNTTCMRLMQ